MTHKQSEISGISASQLILYFPDYIRRELLSDEAVLEVVDIPLNNVVGFGPEQFEATKLNCAIGAVYDDPHKPISVSDLQGKIWQLRKSRNHSIEISSDPKKYVLWDQRYLSKNGRRRLNGLKSRAAGIIPKITLEHFKTILRQHPFSDAELQEFNRLYIASVAQSTERLKAGFEQNKLNWDDLICSAPEYRHELLFGLSIGNSPPSANLFSQLDLLSIPDISNLKIAQRWLSICASREFAYYLHRVCDLTVEELGSLHNWAIGHNSPAILSSYLDFVTFAAKDKIELTPYVDEALKALVSFGNAEYDPFDIFGCIFRGLYGYVSLQSWFDDNQINQKRLFVWAQTNVIMSAANERNTLVRFAQWINLQNFEYAQSALSVELKEMPRWSVKETSPSAIHADQLGRFFLSATESWGDERATEYMSKSNIEWSDVERRHGPGFRLQLLRPGVLEGNSAKGQTIEGELLDVAMEQVQKRPFTSENLIVLANTIPQFTVPDLVVAELMLALDSISLQFDGFENRDADFHAWFEIARLAVERTDDALARRVGRSVWKSALHVSFPMRPKHAAYLFVLLSFAVQDTERTNWLAEYLDGLSVKVKDQDLALDYLTFLRALRSVRPEMNASIRRAINNLRMACQM